MRPPTLVGAPDADVTEREAELVGAGRIYEYVKASNPVMAPQPIRSMGAEAYQQGPSRVIPFDLSVRYLKVFPAGSKGPVVC